MSIKSLLCLASTVALTTATFGHAQSLADAAKQEKQRRAKIRAAGAPAKVYTEGDRLGMSAPEEPTTTTDSTGAAPARSADGAKKKEKTTDEARAEKQQEWAKNTASQHEN